MSRARHHLQDPGPQDGDIEERLLAGDQDFADTPVALSAVAAILAAARGPATPEEFNGEAQLVAAMAATARQRLQAPARKWSGEKKAAALVVGCLALFGSAGVAAATGSLPRGSQDFVAEAVSHLHVTLPTTAHHHPATTNPAKTIPRTVTPPTKPPKTTDATTNVSPTVTVPPASLPTTPPNAHGVLEKGRRAKNPKLKAKKQP